MITHINVKNFKSFLEANFEISNLNLFTGVNGVGKSTLIQVLLLLHQSYLRKGSQYAGELFLNGELISLGTGNDVRAQSADASGILLEVLAEEYEVSLNYLVEPTSGIKENKGSSLILR
jgi:predicted ATPase